MFHFSLTVFKHPHDYRRQIRCSSICLKFCCLFHCLLKLWIINLVKGFLCLYWIIKTELAMLAKQSHVACIWFKYGRTNESSKNPNLKNVFFSVTLSSAARVSGIHALSSNPSYLLFCGDGPVSLLTHPGSWLSIDTQHRVPRKLHCFHYQGCAQRSQLGSNIW